MSVVFELCRRPQQPSLTFHPVGGSTFGLWPCFHLRDGGKMDRNDCHTAWGNFKTLISSQHQYKNYACSFSLIDFFLIFFPFLPCIAIYRLQVTTFLTLA
jgi:hypothetical protein